MFNRLHKNHHFGFGNKDPSSGGFDKGLSLSNTLYDLGILNPRGAPPGSSRSRVNTGASEPPLYLENQYSRRFSAAGSGSATSVRRGLSVNSNHSSASCRVGSIDNNVMSSTMERSRVRRDRSFVGSECTVCEEPLEHTLQGERILQFSCSHAAHEACFYELIRELDAQFCPTCEAPLHFDTGRGGNVIDINKISNMVRSANTETGSTLAGRLAWDSQQQGSPSIESSQRGQSLPTPSLGKASVRNGRETGTERYDAPRQGRNEGELAGVGSPLVAGFSENTPGGQQWRHDLETQTAEVPIVTRQIIRNPVPDPVVTVRSEFPTVNKSRQQQTLTCLVTIEIPDNQWTPDPEDIGLPPYPQPPANLNTDEAATTSTSPPSVGPRLMPDESAELFEELTESLRTRVDNWHGLDFSRFGPMRLYSTLRVGKDKTSWQELECYLFSEMLICVKEKKLQSQWDENGAPQKATRCTLKGSILVKKHLNEVTETGAVDENILTLNLSVVELPQFHLRFNNRNQLKLWHQALIDLHAVTHPSPIRSPELGGELSETEEENEWQRARQQRVSSATSSWGHKSGTTAQTEYTGNMTTAQNLRLTDSMHVPIDVVVVVPISSSMQGVKINLVRDALRFMVNTLGERDRMGIVAFGSGGGGVPVVGMTTKAWSGWPSVLNTIKPVGQKSHRADVVEGANVAMDLLMQRKQSNPIATIMLISDASTSDADSVDFVVSRAEAAKITIHSFGLGMTHKPDTMIELSTRTKASYTYVKDWMMLRECLAGCIGAMQTMSHQNVKLKLKLPEGSPAKFHKISGALQITKRATGRDAEASLGDLRFGDKRDVLIQLVILPDNSSQEQPPQDPWDNIVQGLEVLGAMDGDADRTVSIEEVPLIQADLSWGDILRDGTSSQMPQPSLLAITMLPTGFSQKGRWQNSPPIPPHPSVVQRRMELLTSDMLTRALTLVSRGQHDRAHTLLNETRSILKGLGKGGLPPVPSNKSTPSTPCQGNEGGTPISGTPPRKRSPSPPTSATSSTFTAQLGQSRSAPDLTLGTGIDANTVAALDAELESSLEWINHPAVFGRDSRKAVLQAIGVISSQRAFTFRSPIESLWADRVGGIKRLADRSREWREEGGGEGGIMEEA